MDKGTDRIRTTEAAGAAPDGKVTKRIRLWGIVQGVGFRPYVAKVADRLGMKGEVLNIGGLVDITVTDTQERIGQFVDTLIAEKPGPSEIVHVKIMDLPPAAFDSFTIIKSDEGDDEAAMIPADLAICPDCLRELYDKSNPRYLHPFISCQLCGPRYTIIDRIPYDRDNTSMIEFPMCGFCEGEYTDLHDRRHHAQTISCHDCGPRLLWDGPGAERTDSAILDRAARILKAGGVIAFKSVGGYNLVADPFHEEAVAKLREIKNREAKPFAVMFRSIDEVREYCFVDETEEKLLQSSARPIILLEHKLDDLGPEPAGGNEAGGRPRSFRDLKRSRFIGAFLPSFAAQYLLLDRVSPLIFTSANPSDMPMIKDEEEIAGFCRKSGKVDGILYNKRRINVRVDDSVVRVIDRQPQMIRRSKGYAPVPLYVSAGSGRADADRPLSLLACGGQLKNSFALTKGPFAYMSQFFGDMDTVENQQIFDETLKRMEALFRIRPQAVVCDLHPLYQPTLYGEKYAQEHGVPLLKVQHHHAHAASVMAENNLDGKVIGVAFDGTGYGTDGAIWGGEFLLCENGAFERMAHLKYVDMIGGDSSMKDARRSALSYMAAYRNGYLDAKAAQSGEITVDISDIIQFGAEKLAGCPDSLLVMKALDKGINAIRSSSMGRLFDAVAALLDIKDYNDYEGQCAIMLEDAAAFAVKHPGADRASDLALSFHERIIDMITAQCGRIRTETGARQVALTGGTFQNKILMEGVLEKLRADDFDVYYNISVSPNDGGLALGQAFIGMHRILTNDA